MWKIFIIFILFLSSVFADEGYCLEFFVRKMLFEEPLAYAIFGDKPVSFMSIRKPSTQPFDPFFKTLSMENCVLLKGYHQFKLFSEKFYSSNLIFLFREEEETYYLSVINKTAFIKTVDVSRLEIQNLLSPLFQIDEILDQLIDFQGDIDRVFQSNHTLIGLFLGFGRKNSELYHKRFRIQNIKRRLITEFPVIYCNHLDQVSDTDFQEIHSRLSGFSAERKHLLKPMGLPEFLVDESLEETHSLREKYQSQRKHFLSQVGKKPLLDLVMDQVKEKYDR